MSKREPTRTSGPVEPDRAITIDQILHAAVVLLDLAGLDDAAATVRKISDLDEICESFWCVNMSETDRGALRLAYRAQGDFPPEPYALIEVVDLYGNAVKVDR